MAEWNGAAMEQRSWNGMVESQTQQNDVNRSSFLHSNYAHVNWLSDLSAFVKRAVLAVGQSCIGTSIQ